MENLLKIKLKKLDERAVIPTYAHHGDVGMDMTAIDVEYNEELDTYIYHTGLAFESPFNYGQFLFPRSSNRKTEAYLCNGVGIGDSAIYRGEICFCYKNRTSLSTEVRLSYFETMIESMNVISNIKKDLSLSEVLKLSQEAAMLARDAVIDKTKALDFAPYKVGDKIGQMVFSSYPTVEIEVVEELSSTERGENGFGSTGN